MLFALGALMTAIAVPKQDTPMLRLLLDAITGDPLIATLLAALLAWAAHSSVVVVLLVMSFVANGELPPPVAFALVLGANLGSAINPLLEAPGGGDAAASRLPAAKFIGRLLGCAAALFLIDRLTPLVTRLDPDPVRAVADFHTAFNLLLALLFLPLLGPWAAVLRRILPAKAKPEGSVAAALPRHFGRREPERQARLRRARGAPDGDVLEAMLRGAVDGLAGGDRKRIAETKQLDDVLDRLHGAITAAISGRSIRTPSTSAKAGGCADILTFTKNLESAGDIVEKNLMGLARKRSRHGSSVFRQRAAMKFVGCCSG